MLYRRDRWIARLEESLAREPDADLRRMWCAMRDALRRGADLYLVAAAHQRVSVENDKFIPDHILEQLEADLAAALPAQARVRKVG
jgi:hypothetical protein